MYREVLLRNRMKFFENELVDHNKLIEQQHEIVLKGHVSPAQSDDHSTPQRQVNLPPKQEVVATPGPLGEAEPKISSKNLILGDNFTKGESDKPPEAVHDAKNCKPASVVPKPPSPDRKNSKYLKRVKLFGLIQQEGSKTRKIRLGPHEDEDSSGSSQRSANRWKKNKKPNFKRKSSFVDDSDDELPFSTDIIPSLDSNQSFIEKEAPSPPAQKLRLRPDNNKRNTGDSESLFGGL
jgi:hypothetical protein